MADDLTPEQLDEIAAAAAGNDEECESKVNYKAPAQKSLQEIKEMDQNDDSLRKYKETLLGNAQVVADPEIPNVQVVGMKLKCESASRTLGLDLTTSDCLKTPFVLKEGVEYKIEIAFKVNKEIVSGLKYCQQSFRKGLRVDKADYMVGSYGPRPEPYTFLTCVEEAPKGMLARGNYFIKSKFTDDDKHDHLTWEWNLSIKKDWE